MESATAILTRGAIAEISDGALVAGARPVVVQVLDLRTVTTNQNRTERYRMALSDGVHMHQAMLATQMNGLVGSGLLKKGSLVRLIGFTCNPIRDRKIIIVLELDVVVETCDIIGEPKHYDGTSASALQQPSTTAESSSGYRMGLPAANTLTDGVSLGSGATAGQSTTGVQLQSTPNINSYSRSSPVGSFATNNHVNAAPPRASVANVDVRGSSVSPQNINYNQMFPPPISAGTLRSCNNVYGQSMQPTYQPARPPPLYTNRGPVAKNETAPRIIPIAALNPYQGRWTIKARVTAKGELRNFNSPRGQGKVFSFDLLDSDGGEIRVTCFNMVADQFFGQIEVGKVYLISKGSVRPAQKNFNHLNNDFQILLENTSTIQPCLEEDNSIPKQQFNFRALSEVEGMANNGILDVIGIVSSVNPASTILRKDGTETVKRTLNLKDTSGRSVEITFWGPFCGAEGQVLQNMRESGLFPVLAIKSARVSDFNGKSLGTIATSQLFVDPDFPEAHGLKDWYSREGKDAVSVPLSREMSAMGRTDVRKTVSQIKDEDLGRSEKPDWIVVKAAVTFIKSDNFCYTACPLPVGDRKCSKKVNNNGDGNWHCDRCDQSFPECDYRYLLQLQIQDYTGVTWVTAFQEIGEELMGVSAKELYSLKYEEHDDVKFADIIRNVLFSQYLFKLKVKEETFSDEQRVKSIAVKADKVNPTSESRFLLNVIDNLMRAVPSTSSAKGMSALAGSGTPNVGFQNQNKVEAPSYQGNVAGLGTGTRVMEDFCNKCGFTGHSSSNCTRLMNQQGQSFGGGYTNRANAAMPSSAVASITSANCYKCQQPGHWARDCPGSSGFPSSYGTSNIPGQYGYQKQQFGGF